MLPKINVPLYDCVIPSTKQKIKIRPFLVKEEKVLLIAMESIRDSDSTEKSMIEMNNAVKQILTGCIQTKGIDVEKLAKFDVEYLFLKIRAKSVSEMAEVLWVNEECEADEKLKIDGECIQKFKVNLDEIEVTFPKDHSKKIMLTDDIGVTMKYPTMETFISLSKSKSEIGFSLGLITSCLDNIFNKEDVFPVANYKQKEIDEFLDSLTTEQLTKIGTTFFANMPVVKQKVTKKCERCGKELEREFEGLADFFA